MPYELYSFHSCLHTCVFEVSATLTHSPHHVPVREQEASLCDPPNCECPTQLDREPASLSWVFFLETFQLLSIVRSSCLWLRF